MVMEWIPHRVFDVLAALNSGAFVFGPVILVIFAVLALVEPGRAKTGLLTVVLPLALLSVTCPIVTGTSAWVVTFQGTAASETGTAVQVGTACLAASRSLLYGIVTMIACLAAAAVVHFLLLRTGHAPVSADTVAPMPAAMVAALIAPVAVTALAVDFLARVHLRFTSLTLLVIDVSRGGEAQKLLATQDISAVAATLARDTVILFVGGILLSIAAAGCGVLGLIFSSVRRPSRAVHVCCAICLVASLLAGGWRAARLSASVDSLRSFVATKNAALPAARP